MTTITPPTPTPPLPSTPGTAPVVVAQSPPAALARLPIGQLLDATVMTQTGKDVFQVKTPMGQLTLQSALTLPKGGALVLQLQSQSPFVQFQINSVNGATPALSLKSARPPQFQTVPTSGNAQAASAPKLAPGSVLQATLMRPLSQPLTTSGSLTSATSAATRVAAGKAGPDQIAASPTPPAGKPSVAPASATTKTAGQTGATQAQQSTNAIHNPAKTATGMSSRGGAYLPTGSQLSVKINSVQLPNPVATSPTPTAGAKPGANPGLTTGTSLSGTVTGSTPSGHPIIQTRAGVFALTTQTIVPRGSTVTLDVVTPPAAPMTKAGIAPSLHESMFAARKWPALEEVIQVVQESSPATAQQLIHSIIPRPNAALSAGMIFFLSALRGGEMRSWMGDDILRLIDKSRPNLTGRVSEDFSTLSRIADEPGPGDWRVALIPVNTGAQLEQIRMLLRQHGGEDGEEESGNSDTRFVIDVELSTLGRVQLDGLVRNHGKSLDLIVRSESPMNDVMQNDIRTIFQEAAALTGLNGSVSFQATPPDFIEVPDPSGDHDLGLMV
jgi:hypothetical protein